MKVCKTKDGETIFKDVLRRSKTIHFSPSVLWRFEVRRIHHYNDFSHQEHLIRFLLS